MFASPALPISTEAKCHFLPAPPPSRALDKPPAHFLWLEDKGQRGPGRREPRIPGKVGRRPCRPLWLALAAPPLPSGAQPLRVCPLQMLSLGFVTLLLVGASSARTPGES